MVKKVDGKETRVLRPKRIGPRGSVKPESRESLGHLGAEKREGRKVLVVLTVLEGNCSRYGEAVNIVTDPVTQCRQTLKGKSINARLLSQLVGAKESVRLLQEQQCGNTCAQVAKLPWLPSVWSRDWVIKTR